MNRPEPAIRRRSSGLFAGVVVMVCDTCDVANPRPFDVTNPAELRELEWLEHQHQAAHRDGRLP